VRRAVEHCFAPMTHRLGWRLQFPWARFERWAARSPGVRLIERRAMPPLGHFSLIRFVKTGADVAREGRVQARAIG
jgi:phosphatidylethanolamine/phosphatidyl-N-methylethanolamine N-methyltransferase